MSEWEVELSSSSSSSRHEETDELNSEAVGRLGWRQSVRFAGPVLPLASPAPSMGITAHLVERDAISNAALNQRLLKRYYDVIPPSQREDVRREVTSYSDWGGSALLPTLYSGHTPHSFKEFHLKGLEAWSEHARDLRKDTALPSPRVDVFCGASPRARTWVYQFVFDLRIRTFGASTCLEQEMRKRPQERVFLRVLAPGAQRVRREGPIRRVVGLLGGTMPRWQIWSKKRSGLLDFGNALLRGAGQVYFGNNPLCGFVVLVALAVSSGWLLALSLLGLVCSTVFAHALGVNHTALSGGLFGYNGLLVGGAMSVYLRGGPFNPLALVLVIFGAMFSVVISLGLGNATAPTFGVPPLTIPFVVTSHLLIAAMGSSTHFRPTLGLAPAFGGALPTPLTWDTAAFFGAWMKGVGQIFFADSVWSGVLLVGGLAIYSRVSALAALMGSGVGMATGFMLGADPGAIYAGLWGYNPCLVMIALNGVFYVPSTKVALLAVTGSFMASFATGALGNLLSPLGLPQLTAAFCACTFVFVLIQFSLSNVAPIALVEISTPEEHLLRVRRIRWLLSFLKTRKRGLWSRRLADLDTLHHAPDIPPSWHSSAEGVAAQVLEAAGSGDLRTVRAIVASGVDITELVDYDERTVVHVSAEEGRVRMLRYLLTLPGIRINARDSEGVTPLHAAVRSSSINCIYLLKARGGMIFAPVVLEPVMIAVAAKTRNMGLIKRLYRAGFDFASLKDYDSRTPLMQASDVGDMPMVRLLLRAGCDVKAKDRWGRKAADYLPEGALHLPDATTTDDEREETEDDATVERVERDPRVLQLCNAAFAGHVGEVDALLRDGVDVNGTDYYMRTALMIASAAGQRGVVERLLQEEEVRVEMQDRTNATALSEAAQRGHWEISELLRHQGAVMVTSNGFRLCMAASKGDVRMLRSMYASGANLNAGDHNERTSLHLAACEGQLETVHFLLAAGVTKAPLDKWGNTPYDDAIRERHYEVARLLFDA